jgi:hypothetical protein
MFRAAMMIEISTLVIGKLKHHPQRKQQSFALHQDLATHALCQIDQDRTFCRPIEHNDWIF